MTPSISTALPLRKGTNFAPLEPLLKLRDKSTDTKHYICDMLKERYEHFMGLEKQTWRDLIATGQLVANFIQGKQNLRWNYSRNSFYSVPVHESYNSSSPNDKVTPIMGFYALNCEARYISSNPIIKPIAASEDDRAIQAAKAAKIIVSAYEKKLYTNWHNLQESLLLMSYGTSINRLRWDSSKEGLKALVDIFEEKEFQISEGVGQCYECGHTGSGTEYLANGSFAQCPHCQSTNAYAEPPATQMIPMPAGKQQYNLGDLSLKTLEFPACRGDLRFKAEDSPWFIYEQIVPAGGIKKLLGNAKIPEDMRGENDFGLEVIKNLAASGNAINGATSETRSAANDLYSESIKITEMSLTAEMLAGMKAKGDEKTVDGETIPAGTDYADAFPNGMTAIGVNGMQIILGIYAESHSNELITGIWHMRPHSGAGRGQSDAVDIQRRRNETDSQGYLAMRQNATPATFYVKDVLEPGHEKYMSRPDVAIPVDIEKFPNARSISDLIASPRIGQVDVGMLSYFSETLNNMMQLTMGSTNFTGGLPGVNNKTATGARITDANAEAVFGPMLSIKVDSRIRAAKLIVDNYRENVPIETYFPLETKYGSQNGKWLSGADLEADITFEVEKNSELSKNRFTVIEDNERFFAVVGGAQGLQLLKEQNPAFADELMRRFGVELENNHQDEVAQICRQRFQYAQKLAQQFSQIAAPMPVAQMGTEAPQAIDPMAQAAPMQQPAPEAIDLQESGGMYQLPNEDTPPGPEEEAENQMQQSVMNTGAGSTGQPQTAAPMQPQVQIDPLDMLAQEVVANLSPPITVYEKLHGEKADWFSELLDTDEGREFDPLTRTIVFKMIEAHFVSGTQQQTIFAQLQGQIQTAGAMPGNVAEVQKQKALGQGVK